MRRIRGIDCKEEFFKRNSGLDFGAWDCPVHGKLRHDPPSQGIGGLEKFSCRCSDARGSFDPFLLKESLKVLVFAGGSACAGRAFVDQKPCDGLGGHLGIWSVAKGVSGFLPTQ